MATARYSITGLYNLTCHLSDLDFRSIQWFVQLVNTCILNYTGTSCCHAQTRRYTKPKAPQFPTYQLCNSSKSKRVRAFAFPLVHRREIPSTPTAICPKKCAQVLPNHPNSELKCAVWTRVSCLFGDCFYWGGCSNSTILTNTRQEDLRAWW